MIASMTGFGRGQAETAAYVVTAEVRSVNNRFCEVSVRMPAGAQAHELALKTQVKQAVARGKINVNIEIKRAAQTVPLTVNPALVEQYTTLLETVRTASGIETPMTLQDVLTFSSEFFLAETADADAVANETGALITQALAAALDQLGTMRADEGRALEADLHERLTLIGAELAAVETLAPQRVIAGRERLYERLQEFMDDQRLDRDRLEMELALLADKLDVTEEIVRLHSHLDQFRTTLAADEPVGRKLNFITQEMNREINTIGSKANHAEVTQRVITMKEELEKIREQVQNIE